MTEPIQVLLKFLEIAAYIGGGFLIAFRVAKYYIERDTELKSDYHHMKEDMNELKQNYKNILHELMDIKLQLKDKANRV